MIFFIFIGNSCNKKINILGNYYLKCKYMRYKYIWVISFFYMLIFITIALTIIVSGQKYRITLLTQELSMLKEKVNSLENK